jgi:hypothetical protein
MNFTNQIKEKFLYNIRYNLNYTYKVYFSLRNLYINSTKGNYTKDAEKNKRKALTELFIYLGVLVCVVMIILFGYALYKKYIENKAIDEIDEENENIIINLQNSVNSGSSSSEESKRPHSYMNEQAHKQNFDSEVVSQNSNNNNSFNVVHEERMEKIRKKYGNSLVIKILLKKYIEETEYNKNFFENYGDNCTICVNNFVNDEVIFKTSCEHIFHKNCFNKYLKSIKDNNKLVCPNCNQNLLINKKFLKLRANPEKIRVKTIEKSKMKTSQVDSNNELKLKNNASEITDKKINNDNSNTNKKNKGNDEILFITKKKKLVQNSLVNNIHKNNNNNNNSNSNRAKIFHVLKSNNNKYSTDNKNTNIYNLKENCSSESIKNTKKDKNDEQEKEKDNENKIKNDNNNIIIIKKNIIKSNNYVNDKNDVFYNKIDSTTNLKTQKLRGRLLPKNNFKNIIGQKDYFSSNSKEIDSDRDFVNKISTFKQNLPTSKMDD